MEAANQVSINQESLSISISGDYGSFISKVVRGRRSRSLRPFDVNQLLSIVKNILLCDNSNPQPVNIDTAMVETIRKLSCKLACSCSIRNTKETVEEIISNNYLSKYDWHVAMVTALASFATNYGAFRVFVQSSNDNNQVFKNISLLKQLPEFEYTRKLVGEIDKVMMAAVKMTEHALKLMELRRANNVQISTALGSVDYVAQAACFAIHIVVICSSLITAPADGIVVKDVESMLSNYITAQIETIVKALRDEMQATFQQHGHWQTLVDLFYNTELPSIAAMLNALIGPDANGRSTLVTGNNTKMEVSFEQIKAKGENIYMLITGSYISPNEIQCVAELMKKQTKCQLVWIPISIDIERYEKIQCQMNWYTVRHPSQIRTAAIKFIRETWMFQGQTIMVPLGQKEPECVPIDWICARGYFPGIDSPSPPPLPRLSLSYLLSDIFYPKTTASKTASQPIICLYGGEDLDWITSFSKQWGEFSSVCSLKFQISMEFIYVSKSEGIDAENAKIFDYLKTTKFGLYWKAETMECWRFWIRVQNFLREQIQMGIDMKKETMKEALTLLSYNSNRKGWVVFGQFGTDLKLAQATGDIADDVLKQLFNKKHSTSSALMETLSSMFNDQAKNRPHHCSHVMLPASFGDLGDCIACPICDKIMTNYHYYRCCV